MANGHYWTDFDIDPVSGAEIPVSLREKARREGKDADFYIKEFGGEANALIRQQALEILPPNRSPFEWDYDQSYYAAEGVTLHESENTAAYYSDSDTDYWKTVNAAAGYPGEGEGNILFLRGRALTKFEEARYSRRSFASMTALFATPNDFGAAKGRYLGNWRANLVYRLYTGTPFDYTPLQEVDGKITNGKATTRRAPLHTRTDLNMIKSFGKPNGVSLSLGIEIYNLFNQKDVRSVSPIPTSEVDFDGDRWQRWGIEGVDVYTQQGGVDEIHDVLNYWDSPREMKFSVQVKW